MSKNTVSTSTNSVGSAILALKGMLNRTYSKTPTAPQVKCRIALEKAGIIRDIDDRIKTGNALTSDAYKHFSKLAKQDEGAARVIELAGELAARTKAIAEYKAANPGFVKASKPAPAKKAAKAAPAKKAAKKAAPAAAKAPATKKPFFFRKKKA